MTRRTNFARIALGAGFAALLACTYVSAAHAGDGDSDVQGEESFTDKFMRTLGWKNPGETEYEINYSERSPLVVPPNRNLPPPVTNAVTAPNWPKDPDERARKAVIAAKKKAAPPVARVQVTAAGAPQAINIAPPVTPEQTPIPGTTRPAYANEQNGTARTDPIYDKPGDLFTGGAADLADSIGIGNLFGGSTKTVQVDPGTEPARQALTQPPVGYQTPSANYAYGEQKKGWLDGTSNPDKNPQSQMSSASSVVH